MHIAHSKIQANGFSLIEIVVGLGLAMIATIVIMQVASVFESHKRSTAGGADAQTDSLFALYTIERDVRMAGYGMNIADALGCTVNSHYDGGPGGGSGSGSFSLVPVTITNGIDGAPDTIRVLSSSKKNWSVPARIVKDHPPEATNMFLNTVQGIDVGDLLVGFQPGKDCTLLQVTGIPNGNVQIHHQNTSPWNPPGGQNIFPQPDGYTAGAMLFNLGGLIDHTYTIGADRSLQLSDFRSATNSASAYSLVANVVNLQAQYGFDTRAGTPIDARVTVWSDTIIDADGNHVVGDAGDIRRLYALRVAVVTRSVASERPAEDGSCKITTEMSTNRPVWAAGNIDVSKNPDGSPSPDWKCFRYRVLESVIPLRNLIWKHA